MYGFRKCSLFARIAPGKASTLVGMFPRIERRKMRVLLFPHDAKRKLWTILPAGARHGKSNGHGTALS